MIQHRELFKVWTKPWVTIYNKEMILLHGGPGFNTMNCRMFDGYFLTEIISYAMIN
jgi:hypothetical protein